MHVHTTHLGCADNPNLVMVHGWGMNAAILHLLAERLSQRFHIHLPDLPGHGKNTPYTPSDMPLDDWADALAEAIPQPAVWLGWSLGGMLALRIAARRHQQIKALVLLAATPSFVIRKNWPHGVDSKILADFQRAISTDPVKALNRFAALQVRGDAQAGRQLRSLRKHLSTAPLPEKQALADGLRILEEADLREDLTHLRQPILTVLGSQDPLMPAASGDAMQRLNSNVHVEILPETAHLPFLSQMQRLAQRITHFLNTVNP